MNFNKTDFHIIMSFTEFQGIITQFSKRLSSANNSNVRAEAISNFVKSIENWELPLNSFTPTAIEICNPANKLFKEQFINVIREIQHENIPTYIKNMFNEVTRLSDPNNMLKLLKNQLDTATTNCNITNKRAEEAYQQWINANNTYNIHLSQK